MKQYSILVLLLLAIVSCKKEVKYVIPNYKLEIVTNNSATEYNGQYSTKPIVVKITQAGKQVSFNNVNLLFEAMTTNCEYYAMGATKPIVKYTVENNGNINLYWYTGEKIGKQNVTFWIIDNDTKTKISSVTVEINIIQNPNGFVPSCFIGDGNLLHLEDEKYMFFGHELYYTQNSGVSWQIITSQPPYGNADYDNNTLVNKPFNYYHKISGTLFYTNYFTIFQSFDFGITWKPVIDIENYIGQISTNEHLISYPNYGILKLKIDNSGEVNISDWAYISGATGLIITPSNQLLMNTFDGLLYMGQSPNDSNFTRQNIDVKCDYLYREGNTVYVFSGNKIYTLQNNALNLVGTVNIGQNQQICDVFKLNNKYYVFTGSSSKWGSRNDAPIMLTGNDITQLTIDAFKPKPFFALGLERKWSGDNSYLCVQNESGHLVFKKP